jgi:molybdopterin converting factor small subunit
MKIDVEISFSGKRGFATVLHNGDRLTILPPVGGG